MLFQHLTSILSHLDSTDSIKTFSSLIKAFAAYSAQRHSTNAIAAIATVQLHSTRPQEVQRRFKSCLRGVGDSRWWGPLTMASVGNKAKRLLSVNHNAKTIHHHHIIIIILIIITNSNNQIPFFRERSLKKFCFPAN